MKSLFLKLGIFLFLILTFGCSTINQLTQDGIGQPISTIIDSWGTPARVTSDGRGGSVYIWEQWVDRGYTNGYRRVTTYWADANGIIYKWR